jgi:choline dehydrogenase-like flavoprotein
MPRPVRVKIVEFNRGDNFGNAYFQMNQRRGVRWSATKAYLRPVLKRPNLTVRTGALAERVAIESRDGTRRATGVVVRRGPWHGTLRARREVLLGRFDRLATIAAAFRRGGAAAPRARHRRMHSCRA